MIVVIIRKSLKTSLSKALDPEQHGLGELSARSLIDKKVIFVNYLFVAWFEQHGLGELSVRSL